MRNRPLSQLRCPTSRPRPVGSFRAQTGFTLVALVVITTVRTILVAAAMPMWSQIVKRDREAELVFRGMQYAEAIRVFQLRFQRYPVSLEELLNANPRCLRQLWADPMTDEGQWGLVVAQSGRPAGQRRRGGQTGAERRERLARANQGQNQEQGLGGLTVGSEPQELAGGSAPGGRASSLSGRQAMGPIQGVQSRSTETGVRTFMGSDKYSEWQFSADLIPVPAVVPGSLNLLRANSESVGRSFPPGLEPKQGTAPGAGQGPKGGRRPGQNQQRRRPGG